MAGPPIATQVPARRSEDLLRLTATALVDLSRQHMPRTPVYDGTVQNAFNQLVLLCLRRGVPPPTSVPEMATWAARRPLREWPLSLTEDLDSPEDCLVDPDTHAPTQQCFEWAITAVDPMAEAFENSLMNNALSLTRAAQAPQSYAAFRRLLITRPVLTGTERALLVDDLHLNLMTEVIKTAYEPATAALLRDGMYAECARCHCLLVPVNDGYRCELDRCRKDGYPKVGRLIHPHDAGGVYQLRRPLRIFITGPGLAETDLEKQIRRLGLEVEMWPNFDAYDLRVAFPSGHVWAVDVKDRANPALLGRSARALRSDPPYDRGFLVVPDYRFREREAYGRIFAHHRPDDLVGHLELMSDKRFTRAVRAELRTRRDHMPAATAVAAEGSKDA